MLAGFRTSVVAAASAALLAWHVAAEWDPATSSGSQVQMDFGSDSSGPSGNGDGDGASASGGSAWFPPPRTSTDAWGIDWTWNNSLGSSSSSFSSSSSSSSGSGWYDDADDAGVEVVYPGLDGAVEAMRRQTYHFNRSEGVSLFSTSWAHVGVEPGRCYAKFCVHMLFESDFGAMSAFDAFVLDRVESAHGPVRLSNGYRWDGGGPLPLVLGRLSNETLQRIQANGNDVHHWNESRRTAWSLEAPHGGPDEIDVTLSLKQLYTLLPGYVSPAMNASDGPFYSADPTDQLILRVNAHVPGPFAGAAAMLPVVVNHTGSQLIDVSVSSTLLYPGKGVSGGNEILLTFSLTRRRYGGALPWYPAEASSECERCSKRKTLPDAFSGCLTDRVSRATGKAIEDFLSPRNNDTWLDLKPFAEACFAAIANGGWTNDTNTTAPDRYWDGVQWVTLPRAAEPDDERKRRAIIAQADDALRCWSESQCPLTGAQLKSNAQAVVLRHDPARTVIEFNRSNASFYLLVGLNRSDGSAPLTATTPLLSYDSSPPESIAGSIARTVPNADTLGLDLEVQKHDNLEYIAWWRRYYAEQDERYRRAQPWHSGSASQGSRDFASAGEGSDRDSAGWGSAIGGSDSAAGARRRRLEQWSSHSAASQGSASPAGSDGGSDGDSDNAITGVGHGSLSSGSWSAGSGSLGPPPPTPRALPPERYTLEIRSRNISTPLQVLAVYSDDAQVSFQSTNMSLAFVGHPLNLSKYEYVPPPPFVDLSWSEEPPWARHVRELLPTFAPNGSCSVCLESYEACLFDADCAFGVNDFVRGALQRYAWSSLNVEFQTDPRGAGSSGWYVANVTKVLRDARHFFPPHAYAKFKAMTGCWMDHRCNLDDERMEFDARARAFVQAAPTVLVGVGRKIDILVADGHVLLFDKHYYKLDRTVDFVRFVRETLAPAWGVNATASMQDVDGNVWGPKLLSIAWDDEVDVDVNISISDPNATLVDERKTVLIRARRLNATDSWNVPSVFDWPRLERWLHLFRYVPSSSFPGWNNHNSTNGTGDWTDGSGNGTGGNWTSPWPPGLSAPLSAICGSCADRLQDCVRDAGCKLAMQTWLPMVLPQGPTSAFRDWDDVYRAHWNSDVLNGAAGTAATATATTDWAAVDFSRTRLLALASCLAKHGCPVGVGNTTDLWGSTTVMPTTLGFQASMSLQLTNGSSFYVQYKDLHMIAVADEAATGLLGYLDLIQYHSNEHINYTTTATNDGSKQFTFRGSFDAVTNLAIYGFAEPSYLTPPSYRAWFESRVPMLPSWDFLLAWFGVGQHDADMAARCPACQQAFEACYADADCWPGVQQHVLPILKQQGTPMDWGSVFDVTTGLQKYHVELGRALYDRVISSPDGFQTSAGWQRLTDVLSCVAAAACDVETMSSAMEPPATTHVPSFLKIQPARMELQLYMDSTVQVAFNGQLFEYMETGAGSPQPLTGVLDVAFAGANVPYTVELSSADAGAHLYGYNVTFGDAYYGRVPQLQLLSPGHVTMMSEPFATVTPWRIDIVSTNQFPQWDQLIQWLSSPALSPPGAADTSMFDCDSARAMRTECYASYACLSLLAALVPELRSRLETMTPTFNSVTQQYEVDLTWTLHSHGYVRDTNNSMAAVLDVMRESARCASQQLASATARPVFSDMRVSFARPARGNVTLYYGLTAATLPDDSADPNTDRVASFEQFVYANVLARHGPAARAMHWFGPLGDGVVKHDFEFSRVYGTDTPHLVGADPTTGQTVQSVDSAWTLAFQSPVFALNDAFTPWLTWLATSA